MQSLTHLTSGHTVDTNEACTGTHEDEERGTESFKIHLFKSFIHSLSYSVFRRANTC